MKSTVTTTSHPDSPCGVCAWCWQQGKDHCPSQQAHTHVSWTDRMRVSTQIIAQVIHILETKGNEPYFSPLRIILFQKTQQMRQSKTQNDGLIGALTTIAAKPSKIFMKWCCIWQSPTSSEGVSKTIPEELQVHFRSPNPQNSQRHADKGTFD